MIQIPDDIKVGDLVSMWFLPPNEQLGKGKRPIETELRIGEHKAGWLKLDAPEGGYSIIFTQELLETWNGNVRKL